jgi:signal transduction histidine kinase
LASRSPDAAGAGETAAARSRPILGSGLLLACALTLLLPLAAAAAAIAVSAVLWWIARLQPGRLLVGIGLGLTAVLLAAALVVESWPEPRLEDTVPILEDGYARLWDDVAGAAAEAAAAVGALEEPPRPGLETGPAFELLRKEIGERGVEGLSLLLVDPDSTVTVWAGHGLLHEPDPFELPRSGRTYRQGYTAATLLAVAPVTEDRRPWRVVAGLSMPTDRLPFAAAGSGWPAATRWSLGDRSLGDPGAAAPAGGWRLAAGDGPVMIVRSPEDPGRGRERAVRRLRRAGLIVLGCTLLTLPILRVLGLSGPGGLLPLLLMAGFAAWCAAMQVPAAVAAALVAAAGFASWGFFRPRPASLRDGGGELAGALAAVVLAAAAWAFQSRFGRYDLGATLGGSPTDFALRLTMACLSLGALRLCGRRLGPSAGDGAAWLGAAVLSAAAALHDRPLVALPLAAVGAALTVRWLTGVDLRQRPAALTGLLVLAAILAGVCWETAYREVLREEIEHEVLPKLAPPTSDEVNDFLIELFDSLEGRDLGDLLDRPGAGTAADLAYRLWLDSPLARRDGLSALVVEPADGKPSKFTFGLSLGDDLELAARRVRWQVPPVAAWRDGMILGESRLTASGRPWGRARYWFLPRPGFRFEVSEVEELDAALVRGELHRRAADGLPAGVLYGLYSVDGEAVVSPWQEQPALPRPMLAVESSPGKTSIPGGRAWTWSREEVDGIEVLYLPVVEPLEGLERMGVHALGSLALIASIGVLLLLFALPRGLLAGTIERSVRSYSKRLILVFTVLLLLPLIALNLFLLRDFESRLQRDQQTRANEAIGSAGDFILDYLAELPQGTSIETRLNEALLEWVASIVHHQVTVYLRSKLFDSSQRELFTTGLLPERIPGDVHSRLTRDGLSLDHRTRRRGDLTYREYYAPLRIPDFSQGSGGADVRAADLFSLSVPILDQEEDDARELAAMRRRAVLVTSALFLILAAVGSRLARSFTEPIMELIEGTRRIADGASFLDVTPRERELSSLADAIDEMARSIAEGRRRLVLEKQVVERIVDNIASAVVSLDSELRVRLQNKVAEDLLGTEVGVEIRAVLDREPRFHGVAAFLERVVGEGDGPRQETLRLPGEGDESREWALIWVPLPGEDDPASLLVVDDVTEVVRGQRLAAWAEMARIIAHEIKNPLTPIQLSTEHMRQVWATDPERFEPVLKRCTDNILVQVEELRDIASEFSAYSRIPQAEVVPGDLLSAMQELIDTYRDVRPRGVEIELVCDLAELPARFDKKLLVRAVRNLLENALRANAGRGRIEVRLERQQDEAWIRVADSGPGVEPANLHRIFEPYFSTHESGTGLGLAITRRIVEEHGGRIEARNRDGGGLEVVTALPLLAEGDELPAPEGEP